MHAAFYILAALTIAGMSSAMGLRHLVHCILALTLGFAGLAALYLLLGAQFVGFTQILVYIGAVAILAVFAIMMTRSAGPIALPTGSSFWLTGALIAGTVFAVLAWAICSANSATQIVSPTPEATVNQIGDALMHRYILPLELMGVLLTAALIGAVILAMQDKEDAQ